ncbi:MAG: hypothetical protein Q8P68_01495 [Candidatus Peregrinibacteria bacterium]|nr:hypothetical protein [Candidatus Peregrinibacteria bacterium]
MRAILNVSLPPDKKKEIERRAKKMGLSISSYVLYTIDLEQKMISEDELLERIKEAEKNYKEGKTKILKSLADLM